MAGDEPKNRTKAFANSVLQLVQALPDKGPACMIGGQLLRTAPLSDPIFVLLVAPGRAQPSLQG
jgi:hypothetical protein